MHLSYFLNEWIGLALVGCLPTRYYKVAKKLKGFRDLHSGYA